MRNAFTKLAASIATRNAGKLLGLTGLGAGAVAGLSHGLDAASMGLDDAITYGKSYYSPILEAIGLENLAKINNEAAEAVNQKMVAALQAENPGRYILNLDTPEILRPRHLVNTSMGGIIGAMKLKPVSSKKIPKI